LSYVAGKIAGLKAQLPEPKAPAPAVAAPVAAVPNAPPSGPAAPAMADDLRGQVQALQAANTTLQAKLKEALAAQPATADSRELVKAQEKIESLMKENDLLKSAWRRANPARTPSPRPPGRTRCGRRNWR